MAWPEYDRCEDCGNGDRLRYYRACSTTLEFAYGLGITTLIMSLILGFWNRLGWLFSIWGILYFFALRCRWYGAYNKEK